ncbi:class I adenylate-forming enzyme family protein [Rhodococcus sp. (in: high G+C Gram-positive bacteria)]|uniref:class I adenylate-forming enzyme family protein n=2 Tax=Rhodococcus sp. TaxID=1831 RepID=UPI0019FD8BA4|nr:class I adenylate-forming enzyme family protein [Rhodococcus sp. (in: high G+C Gram-positive bacteria)]MBF0662320.1 acyl--CoA ligase [Rhodococcus sp. (in: high G+C Gram-positive bacteria)]
MSTPLSHPPTARACHPDATVSEYLERGWWQDETLPDLFDSWVQRRPSHAATTDPANLADLTGAQPRSLTWQELDEFVRRVAAVFHARGIRQDDTVAVQMPNSVALTATYLALWRLGAVATPMPASYRRHELSGIVDACSAVAVVTVGRLGDRSLATEASELASGHRTLGTVFAFGPHVPEQAVEIDTASVPAPHLDEADAYAAAVVRTVNDRVTVCWTSGTEAAPKGVPRCHADWLAVGRGVQDGLETTEDSVLVNPFPLVNMAGFAAALLPWLLGGGHLVHHHPLDIAVYLGQIQHHRATHTTMPPAILTMLLKNDALRGKFDLSSLTRVGAGGAPLPPSVVASWQNDHGVEVINFFGSNEGVCLLGAPGDIPDPTVRAQHLPNYAAPDRSWVVRLSRSTEVRLIDPVTGALVDTIGGRGELRLKGPTVFAGYLEGTATSSPFDEDGFLCSGDVFELCGEHGEYLRFVDRIKEIVIRGGMNIAPAEIEGLLQDHPAVAEVAIIGIPDEVLGEKCCAVVVPTAGATPTLDDLTAHLRARDIASFKLPERIELVDTLPRNAVGKLLRRHIRTDLLESL